MATNIDKLSLKELEALTAQIEVEREKRRTGAASAVRTKIDAILKSAGLELSDVYGDGKAPSPRGRKAERGRPAKAVDAAEKRLPAKYRNPKDAAQTWSGRGKRPRWYVAAQKAGVEKDLLVR